MPGPADILDYLAAKPDEMDARVIESNQNLQNAIQDAGNGSLLDFEEISRRRYLASNTLTLGNQERLGWKRANKLMMERLPRRTYPTLDDVADIHKKLLPELAGRWRKTDLYTCDETYLPPDYFDEARRIRKGFANEKNPLVSAFQHYTWQVTVHPFPNGNGRCARLCADWVLIAHDHLPVCYPSSVQSHVAMTLGGCKRNKEGSFANFLEAISWAYKSLKFDNPAPNCGAAETD